MSLSISECYVTVSICTILPIINLPLNKHWRWYHCYSSKLIKLECSKFCKILSWCNNMNLRIDERTSKYEANGASMLGDAGFSQKIRKLGGNCFLSPRLTQLFVTFAPLKRVSRKLSFLLIQNWRARTTKMRYCAFNP